jgi:hypothetical protein
VLLEVVEHIPVLLPRAHDRDVPAELVEAEAVEGQDVGVLELGPDLELSLEFL